MKTTPLLHRAVSLALALMMTAGMLGGIDRLAGEQDASPLWAAAVVAPRG
ncbi:hypothetical protein [Pseudorhodoferax sp.]|nr:hypothetical protein [Pseudorhodoferax sp.]